MLPFYFFLPVSAITLLREFSKIDTSIPPPRHGSNSAWTSQTTRNTDRQSPHKSRSVHTANGIRHSVNNYRSDKNRYPQTSAPKNATFSRSFCCSFHRKKPLETQKYIHVPKPVRCVSNWIQRLRTKTFFRSESDVMQHYRRKINFFRFHYSYP